MGAKSLSNAILVVDDDIGISSLINSALQVDGFPTLCARDGEEALVLWKKHSPSLIILDLMLPKIDGIDVCRQIRRQSSVPILMLTVKADEFDEVLGTRIGADDYLNKPFSPRELRARVKTILRLSHPDSRRGRQTFRSIGLEIDFSQSKATVRGKEIKLTLYENKILESLTGAPGRVFSREQLIEGIYSHEEVSVADRVIDVHMGNLWAKIEKDSSHPEFIVAVRGMGYKFSRCDAGQ